MDRVIGGFLIGAFGWRSIFLLDVRPRSSPQVRCGAGPPNFGALHWLFDVAGGLLMITTLSAAMVVLVQAESWGLNEPTALDRRPATIAMGRRICR